MLIPSESISTSAGGRASAQGVMTRLQRWAYATRGQIGRLFFAALSPSSRPSTGRGERRVAALDGRSALVRPMDAGNYQMLAKYEPVWDALKDRHVYAAPCAFGASKALAQASMYSAPS